MRRAISTIEDTNPVSPIVSPVVVLNKEIGFLSKIQQNIARVIEKKKEDIPFLEARERELEQSVADLEKKESELTVRNVSVSQLVKNVEQSIKFLDESKAYLEKEIKEKADYLAGLEAKAKIIALVKGDIDALTRTKLQLVAEVSAKETQLNSIEKR